MYSTLPESTHGSLSSMVLIEARRFARHPLFLVGTLAAIAIMVLFSMSEDPSFNDMLSTPVVAAFFIGLPSLVVAARLVRSTEAAAEAMGTAPGTEARRTLAVAGACVVPFLAGLLWLAALFAALAVKPPHANELWFGTVNDLYVWSLLFALGPVACLGGGLLGVLVGRWLQFPGAPAVMVVVVVAVDLLGQVLYLGEDILEPEHPWLRLWVPWAMWHTGTLDDGRQGLLGGHPGFYLLYLLCLCALAVLGAVWHDRTARTGALKVRILGVLGLALVFLALAMTTGIDTVLISEVLPFKVGD